MKPIDLICSKLEQLGATRESHSRLFVLAIANSYYADKVTAAFEALDAIEMSPDIKLELFIGVIHHADDADKLPAAIKVLQSIDITPKDRLDLLKQVIARANDADGMAVLFNLLETLKTTRKSKLALFKQVIAHADDVVELIAVFNLLQTLKTSPQDKLERFKRLIPQINSGKRITTALTALDSIEVIPEEKVKLFVLAIKYAVSSQLPSAINALNVVKIPPQNTFKILKRIIQNEYPIAELAKVFHAWASLAPTEDETLEFIEVILDNQNDINGLVALLRTLHSLNMSMKNDSKIIKSILQESTHYSKLANQLMQLKASGIADEKSSSLSKWIMMLIKRSANKEYYSISELTPTLQSLMTLGVSTADMTSQFFPILQKANYIDIDDLPKTLAALQTLMLPQNEKVLLAKLIIELQCEMEMLPLIIDRLKRDPRYLAMPVDGKRAFIEYMIRTAGFSDHSKILQEILSSTSTCSYDTTFLFKLAMQDRYLASPEELNNLIQALSIMKIVPDEHPELMRLMVKNARHADNFFYIFSTLNMLAPDPKIHLSLFEQLLRKGFVTKEAYNASAILDVLQTNLSPNPESAPYPVRRAHPITEGPLNRSSATQTLETILQRITSDPSTVKMSYDRGLGYILQFGIDPPIYLTELLQHVNFNHVSLSATQLDSLNQIMATLLNKVVEADLLDILSKHNPIAAQLPPAAKRALEYYISYGGYININRLFRGVVQKTATDSPGSIHSDDLLKNFLSGCLINWAAAEAPRILYRDKERTLLEKIFLANHISHEEVFTDIANDIVRYQILLEKARKAEIINVDEYHNLLDAYPKLVFLFPMHPICTRGEILDEKTTSNEPDTVRQRIANPVTTTAVTSMSVFSNGDPIFVKEKSTDTKFVNGSASRVVLTHSVGETLIPAGTTMLYTQASIGGKPGFFASEVNSPGITPLGDEWSSSALAVAFQRHLRKPYKDREQTVVIDHTKIERPNHGLAHAYRVQCYIDVVINYFAHHAKDERFRAYCKYMTTEERSWLRVAAAFSVTGYESEDTASENPGRYDQYRQSCETNLKYFLDNYPTQKMDSSMAKRMLHVVRWMGNPDYEAEKNISREQVDREYHQDTFDEYHHRNFLQNILSVAHNLDLLRCDKATSFDQSMEKCRTLSQPSSEQQSDYIGMITYAIDLIKAHGDQLCTTLSNTKLSTCYRCYRSPFERVSTSLRYARSVTETVPRPIMTEAYQFTNTESPEVVSQVLRILK